VQAVTDGDTLLVLHAIRLRSVAPADTVAARFGLAPAVVDRTLERLAGQGWIVHRAGIPAGWSLTADGRTVLSELLATELDGRGARDRVESGYRHFLSLNTELLSVCTDWQVRRTPGGEVVNDHADAVHDARVLRRLDGLHGRTLPLLADLAAALDRLVGYGDRLERAYLAIRSGATEWLTRPTIDSYHTVWFELHEDLLATLGRTRTDERTSVIELDGAAAGRVAR
jgi:hypothetical protein